MVIKASWIGLGVMGFPMAGHLTANADVKLTVYNRSPEKADKWTQKYKGKVAATPGDAAADADFVFACVGNDDDLRSVTLGPHGAFQKMRAGSIFVDHTTASADVARELFDEAKKRGIGFIDAPVSGGTGGAEAATLTFMVGGDALAFAQAQPILASMGKNIVHCGASGNGQVAKICNNMLLAISMIGTAETMSLGAKLGIDPKLLAGIINTSSGRCWSSDTYNPYPGVIQTAPASRAYTGGFGADLMLKDLGLAVDAARAAKQPVALGSLAQQLYQMMSSRGDGGKDFSAIINLFSDSK